MKRASKLVQRRNRQGYFYIMPFLVGFVCFLLIPLVQSVWFSFSDVSIVANGYTAVSYTHLDVYKRQVLACGNLGSQYADYEYTAYDGYLLGCAYSRGGHATGPVPHEAIHERHSGCFN